MSTVLFTGLVALLALSVPIAVTLGLSSILALQVNGMPLVIALAQSVFEAWIRSA